MNGTAFGILGLIVLVGLMFALIVSKRKRPVFAAIIVAVIVIAFFMLLVPYTAYVEQQHHAISAEAELQFAREAAIAASVAENGDRIMTEHVSNGYSAGVYLGDEECANDVVAQTSAVALVPTPPAVAHSRGRAPSISETDSRWGTARNIGALAAFMCLIYLFLDANRRPRYAWAIRVSSVAAFIGLCIALLSISPL